MNIKELAEQAEEYATYEWPNPNHKAHWQECRDERFEELIRQDEREQISHTYLKLTLDAVLREREACSDLIANMISGIEGVRYAEAILQRGEQP